VLINIVSEFLVHAAEVEGLCQGIDEDLVRSTSATLPPRPIIDQLFCRIRGVGEDTYYVRRRCVLEQKLIVWRLLIQFQDLSDFDLVDRLSEGRVDLTYGR
jgi:hypothetical protein